MQGCAYSYDLICHIWLVSLGSLPFFEGEGGRMDLGKMQGAGKGLGGQEGGEIAVGME